MRKLMGVVCSIGLKTVDYCVRLETVPLLAPLSSICSTPYLHCMCVVPCMPRADANIRIVAIPC